MILKKTLINFALIQTVIFTTSVSIGFQVPIVGGPLATVGLVWMFAFFISLIPTVALSLLFAFYSESSLVRK